MKTATFFRNLFWMIPFALGILCVQAQSVPGAIKYQAVLRDVNGKTLADKSDVSLRISLRLDDPFSGTIAYSEEHDGVSTNAYGVIHLEIGRGTVTSGTTLNAVPWGEHKVYVQIEIETDGTGYTHMGDAELLTVPYAFYAENASGKNLYENLKDNFLPKYNETGKTLVNSGLSQTGRALEVDASSVTFVDVASGKPGYSFPMAAGKKGQVLRLADNAGTLVWDTAGGGGSVGGGDVTWSLGPTDDGRMLYWNNTLGDVQTAPFYFGYDKTLDFILSGNLALEGTVSGTNNLLVSDRLDDGQIWIGDNHATAANTLTPRSLSGHILMDKEGKTNLNLVLKGLSLIPGLGTDRDTLQAESGGESLWRRNAAEDIYAFNNAKATGPVFVGIGTDTPKSLLHVAEGEVRFTGSANTEGNTPVLLWNPAQVSLFAGSVSAADLDAYLGAQGRYSVSLGPDALAAADYGLAFGNEANVTGNNAVAIGTQSVAAADNTIAMGYDVKVNGNNSLAIGEGSIVRGNNTVIVGGNSQAGSNAIAVGYGNGNSVGTIDDGIVLGNNNTQISRSIIVGSNNNLNGDNTICIGKGNNVPTGGIVMGSLDIVDNQTGPTVFGSVRIEGNAEPDHLVSVGRVNTFKDANTDSYSNMIGSWLTNEGNYPSLTMIGNEYSSTDAFLSVTEGDAPRFICGFENFVPFEIANSGTAYFVADVKAMGDIWAGGMQISSDFRLKTDIKPLSVSPALLDSLQAVSFVLKSDRNRNTRFGFIAQEVRKVFPQLVRENAKGMLRMDYIGLVPVLWQINQQLSRKLAELEGQVKEQNRRQLELENELQAIKAKLGM